MKSLITIGLLLFVLGLQAQVGIGTTTPNGSSILDVTATDKGVLIPRMSLSQRNMIATPVEGLLIYQTDNTPGFYYYNGAIWASIATAGGVQEINDLTDAKTLLRSVYLGNGAGAANISGDNQNTAVGDDALSDNTSGIQNVAIGESTMLDNTTGERNTVVGQSAMRNNSTGSFNTVLGEDALYSNISGSGNIAIGRNAGYSENGNNKLYIENTGATSNSALIYGEFDNNILRTNSEFQIGNPTMTGYAFPVTDGTANQVLSTNGSGQLTFSSPAAGSSDADWFLEGATTAPLNISDDIYTQGNVAIGKNTADSPLDIEVTGSPTNLIAMKIVDNSTGTGDHIGIQESLGGTHNESIKGIETYIANTGTGLHTGISTSVQNGTGNQVGNRTIINGSAGNNTSFSGTIFNSGTASTTTQTGVSIGVQQPSSQISYGTFNTLNASGAGASGIKYGIYNLLDGGLGDHFGVYNDIRGTENNTKYGTYNLFGIGTTDTGGILYGTYNNFGTSITSTLDKYGSYTIIPSSLSGEHYGVFSDVQNATGYAGYFIGNVSFGTTTSNRYTMPAADGAAGEVLTAAGDGTTSWAATGTGGTRSILKGDMVATSQVLTGTSTLNFDNILIDTNSEYDVPTHRFTATSSGYYKVTLGVYVNSSTASSFTLNIRKNAITPYIRIYQADATANQSHNTSAIVQLDAGDFLTFFSTVNPSSDTVTVLGYSERTHLEIHRID